MRRRRTCEEKRHNSLLFCIGNLLPRMTPQLALENGCVEFICLRFWKDEQIYIYICLNHIRGRWLMFPVEKWERGWKQNLIEGVESFWLCWELKQGSSRRFTHGEKWICMVLPFWMSQAWWDLVVSTAGSLWLRYYCMSLAVDHSLKISKQTPALAGRKVLRNHHPLQLMGIMFMMLMMLLLLLMIITILTLLLLSILIYIYLIIYK